MQRYFTSSGADQYLVSVTLQGNGAGRVTSTPGGIDCPGDCSQVL